jgi:general secretion pathway protein K
MRGMRDEDMGEKRMKNGRIASQKGMALVMTLLILTLLVVVGLELNRAVRVEANLAGNFRDLTQSSYIAQSGVEMARVLLQRDDPAYDGLDEQWAQFETLASFSQMLFPEGSFAGRIVDENSKLNPNGLIDRFGNVDPKKKIEIERLLVFLGDDPGVLDAILDWLDPDDLRRPQGEETDYYRSRKNPYSAKNGPMDFLGEMLLIRGIGPSTLYGSKERQGLKDFLSVYSDGRLNINTAGLIPLMCLSPEVDRTMAQAVLDARREKPFRTAEDLRLIPGWTSVYPRISSEITVQSTTFSVEVVSTYREARTVIQAVVKREGPRTKILMWKAG